MDKRAELGRDSRGLFLVYRRRNEILLSIVLGAFVAGIIGYFLC